MPPLGINMMLHFYAIAEPFPRIDAPACQELLHAFLSERMIETDSTGGSGYRVTERGLAYVAALEAVQLPICKWVQPT